MKKEIRITFIMCVLMISTVVAIAQSTVKSGVEITRPVNKISYETAFILELGKDNVLRVEPADTSIKRLLVNVSQGIVKQQGQDFIIHPESPGEIILSVYNYNDLSHPVLLEKRKLEVMEAPKNPVAMLGGKQGGKITKEELARINKLELMQADSSLKILQFDLSVVDKDLYRHFNASDENLTPEMKAAIGGLSTGGKINVEWIRAGNEFVSSTRKLAPLSFTVEE